jgi:hypothetical protein
MILPNGKETMSVGDLRKVLEGLDDNLPVEIFPEITCCCDGPHGYYVPKAKVHPDSGISSKALNIYLGEGYRL